MKLWYADIRTLEYWSGLEKAKRHLTPERLKKLDKYKKKEDVLRGIGAGLLLEYGLLSYGLTGKDVHFFYGEDGKPMLADVPDLYFNLTHSGSYAAAVFADAECGVDVEKVKEGRKKTAKRFFAEDEKAFLEYHWSDEQFTKIWTRKESYAKAVGGGIRLPFPSFSTLEDKTDSYYLKSYDCIPEYWLSVCIKEKVPGGVPEEVKLIEIFN